MGSSRIRRRWQAHSSAQASAEILGPRDHPAYQRFCRWLALRLLVPFGLLEDAVGSDRPASGATAALLGIPARLQDEEQIEAALSQLQAEHTTLCRRPPAWPRSTQLARNLALLAERLGLSDLETQLLHLLVLVDLFPGLSRVASLCDEVSHPLLVEMLAACLMAKPEEIRPLLEPDARLQATGLVALSDTRSSLARKIEVPNELAERLLLPPGKAGVMGLFSERLRPAPPPGLSLAAYPHLTEPLAVLQPLLRHALQERRRGVNVLLHGAPGTGKTQLTAALAAAVNGTLYELALAGRRNKAIQGTERLASYRLAQGLLANAPGALLLFDEVEDVFEPQRADEGNASGLKGWINHCLETNPVPAFWVTNSVRGLDPAYLRRFDMVLEVPRPPLTVRRKLLEEQTAGLALQAEWVDAVAAAPGWSPALLTRAVAVVQSLQTKGDGTTATGTGAQHALTRLLNGSLAAMGEDTLPESVPAARASSYRLELANTDVPLAQLLAGLRAQPKARLLFHGAPGTGKTGFARHLASELGLTLQVEQASTLLSAFVGGTERNLAMAFEKAQRDGALLLIDEVDSLLQNRQQAVRNWEVSQVNELLTQLEGFEGLFIATTNFIDHLDRAALRRFDLKLRFAPLRPEQAADLLADLAQDQGLCPQTARHLAGHGLAGFTVGDIEAYRRQLRLAPPASEAALLQGLQQSLVQGSLVPRAMGFIA